MNPLTNDTPPNKTVYATPLEQWFHDACYYETLKARVMKGELQQLPAKERLFLIAFITRNNVLHTACQNISYTNKENDDDFVKALVEAGADVNATNTDGKSLLASARTAELFSWLTQRGAKLAGTDGKSLLIHVMSLVKALLIREDDKSAWLALLPDILKSSPLDHFCQLDKEHICSLIRYAKKIPAIAEIVLQKLKFLISEKPQVALDISEMILGTFGREEEWKGFLWMVKQGHIQDPFIQQILTSTKNMFWNAKDESFYVELEKCWQPTGDLASILQLCCDLRIALFYKSILDTKTLEESAFLFSRLDEFPDPDTLDPKIKTRVVAHIQELQKKEKSTIWVGAGERSTLYASQLLRMKQIGMDPNWTDPIHHHNFLFTKKAWHLKYDKHDLLGFDRSQIDSKGNNALEYHCRHPNKAGDCIRLLAEKGLRLGDNFPNVHKCRQVFPDNPFLQAFLGAALLNHRKFQLHELFQYIPKDQRENFYQAVRQDPELEKLFGKMDGCKNPNNQLKIDDRKWREKYQEADIPRLESIPDRWGTEYLLALFATFWKEKVPSEALNLIPESPMASLVISVIKKQNETLVSDKNPLKSRILFGNFSHDDLVYFNRYIFKHPEIMRILVQTYMKVKKIYIQAGGGTISTHAKFVEPLLTSMGELLQIPRFSFDKPKWQQKIDDAFNEIVHPIPKETLDLPEGSKLRLHGRTIVVDKGNQCEGLKFLRKGEEFKYFAQEFSVTNALNQAEGQFKSRFLKPIGVYAVRKLPASLEKYREQLSIEGPAFVFHYSASPGKFRYLQDLPHETYEASRDICLHDSAKLEKMGIYPDLGLSHDELKDRLYVLLVDLMARLISKHRELSMFYPAGGAGCLEAPWRKMRYPNATEDGLTDSRDARKLHGQWDFKPSDMRGLNFEKSGGVYFSQMEGFSKGILSDLLMLAERYINDGLLQWKDENLMQQFGKDIAKGFAKKISFYADQPLDESLRFVHESGINWTLCARQIAFWTDTGPEGYPACVAKGKLPEGIYEKKIEVFIDASDAKNFNPVTGCSTKGDQDIGLYKGPLALTELEKAMHLTFNPVALAEPLTPPPVEHRSGFGWREDF